MDEIVAERHCKKILSNLDSTSILESYEVKPLAEESLGGLIGQHFKLHINYKLRNEHKDLKLFVKTLNKDSPTMYRISENLQVCEKEELILMKLLPLYESRGINVSFAPRGYLCEDKVMIIEDLSLLGFKLAPKNKPLDLPHCYSSLTAIAKFHASSILYEVCKSKSLGVQYNLFREYPELLGDLIYSGGDNCGATFVTKSIESLIVAAEIEFGDSIDLNKFQDLLISNGLSNNNDMYCTVLHGDVWCNNFLHLYEGNKLIETKLIDYQMVKYGPPGLDVLLFIYSNTRKKFRDENLQHLVIYYYQVLGELLHDRALYIGDYLPREDYLKSCESLKILAKIQATVDHSITFLPDEVYLSTLGDDETFHDYALENRGKYMKDFYTNIPKYREILSEDLRELKDMLFPDL